MKRSCLSKLPTWIKNKSPYEGITISKVLLFSTILMPVALVGSDMISDGGVLAQMWQQIMPSRVGSNSTEVEQGGQSGHLDTTLFTLFLVSILILLISTGNLLRSNWLSTLLRNARTTLMMESRELERKDAPVPLGDNLIVLKL